MQKTPGALRQQTAGGSHGRAGRFVQLTVAGRGERRGTRLGIRTTDDGRPGSNGGVASEGVSWTLAHRDSGSRQNSWELLCERLKNVMKPDRPLLSVFNTCRQLIRTAPVLPRDEIDMEDVDSTARDHVGEAASRPWDERKKLVPQPLRASLSLRDKGLWNHDQLFESGVRREQR